MPHPRGRNVAAQVAEELKKGLTDYPSYGGKQKEIKKSMPQVLGKQERQTTDTAYSREETAHCMASSLGKSFLDSSHACVRMMVYSLV